MCERLHEVLATCYCAKANPKGLPLSLTRACLSGLDINICIYIYIYSANTSRSEKDFVRLVDHILPGLGVRLKVPFFHIFPVSSYVQKIY